MSARVGTRCWAGSLFSLGLSQAEWTDEAAAALLGVMGPPSADGMVIFWDRRGDVDSARTAWWRGDNGWHMAFSFPKVTLPDARARVIRSRVTTVTSAGLWTEATKDLFHDMRCGDALGVGAGEPPIGLIAARLLERRTRDPAATQVDRRKLARVVRTVSLAWTARTFVSAPGPASGCDAIFTPSGSVVHAVGAAARPSSLDALRHAVLRIERERGTRTTMVDGDAIWSSLVCGRWSLIDDYEDGRQRYVLAIRNDRWADDFSLSKREARTIELAVLGKRPKEMTSELGISLSRIYALQQSALDKLGARCIGDVRALARRLPGKLLTRVSLGLEAIVALKAPAAIHDLSRLTDAERAVVRDLACALSRGEIARRRKRSVRTVANQVSSIYKKLMVSDRNELIALLRAM